MQLVQVKVNVKSFLCLTKHHAMKTYAIRTINKCVRITTCQVPTIHQRIIVPLYMEWLPSYHSPLPFKILNFETISWRALVVYPSQTFARSPCWCCWRQ